MRNLCVKNNPQCKAFLTSFFAENRGKFVKYLCKRGKNPARISAANYIGLVKLAGNIPFSGEPSFVPINHPSS